MANLNQTENIVSIEGILSEINLTESTYNNKTTHQSVPYIGGYVKVRANIEINKKPVPAEITVNLFANRKKKDGKDNPIYDSIKRIKDDYVSIAASDIEHADRVRIPKAHIEMNEYYGINGNLISFPRIKASFVNKIRAEDCKDDASFSVVFMVAKVEPEVKNDEETGRYVITGILPQYGGKVDKVEFVTATPQASATMANGFWNEGDTVKAIGKLNFTSTTEEKTVEVDFGEPLKESHTVSVSELAITGGAAPIDGEFAIDYEEVKVALAERKRYLDGEKEKAAQKTQKHSGFEALGF